MQENGFALDFGSNLSSLWDHEEGLVKNYKRNYYI